MQICTKRSCIIPGVCLHTLPCDCETCLVPSSTRVFCSVLFLVTCARTKVLLPQVLCSCLLEGASSLLLLSEILLFTDLSERTADTVLLLTLL